MKKMGASAKKGASRANPKAKKRYSGGGKLHTPGKSMYSSSHGKSKLRR